MDTYIYIWYKPTSLIRKQKNRRRRYRDPHDHGPTNPTPSEDRFYNTSYSSSACEIRIPLYPVIILFFYWTERKIFSPYREIRTFSEASCLSALHVRATKFPWRPISAVHPKIGRPPSHAHHPYNNLRSSPPPHLFPSLPPKSIRFHPPAPEFHRRSDQASSPAPPFSGDPSAAR